MRCTPIFLICTVFMAFQGLAQPSTITVHEDHLILMRNLRVNWVPIEAQAPLVLPDAPFGSESILQDLQRILGTAKAAQVGILNETAAKETVQQVLDRLKIFLAVGELEPGTYDVDVITSTEVPLEPWIKRLLIPGTSNKIRVQVSREQLNLFASLRVRLAEIDYSDRAQAPEVIKRPYGNMTNYKLDMLESLGWQEEVEPASANVQSKRLTELHESMAGVLQAFLRHAKFEPGIYEPHTAGTTQWLRRGPAAGSLVVDTRDHDLKVGIVGLIEAIRRKQYGQIRALLDSGINPMLEDASGQSPFQAALTERDLEAASMFIETSFFKVNEAITTHKETPLILAARWGMPDLFAKLIKMGASIDVRDRSGSTALGAAYSKEEVDPEIAAGRRIVVQEIRKMGWTEPAMLGVFPDDRSSPNPRAMIGPLLIGASGHQLGLLPKDIITRVDSTPVQTFKELADAIGDKKAFDSISIELIREGRTMSISGEIGPRSTNEPILSNDPEVLRAIKGKM